MVTVIKRDGTKQKLNIARISNAVKMALNDNNCKDDNFAEEIAKHVEIKITKSHQEEVHIQEIQETVENLLMKSRYKDVARSYIEYRYDRDIIRDAKSNLATEITGLVSQTNTALLNENANKDGKIIPTQRDLLAGIVSKDYALKHLLPKDIARAHKRGDIHHHDLDYAPFFPMVNCCLIDLDGMLKRGFKVGNAIIDTPKSIQTAATVTTQIIAQVASHIYGGNTINRIDEVLAPYVALTYNKHLAIGNKWITDSVAAEAYATERTEKDCYDACQTLEYQISSLSTSNGQTPFCTFGFGLGTSKEARLIQKCILQVRIDGLGKNKKTAIFPKLVFGIKEGTNRLSQDPNYDIKQLALECSAKRMYPDILNYDQIVKVTGSYKAPMGCRSFLGLYEEDGVEVHEGRNNLGVVSINLPRIALQSKSIAEFYKNLDKKLLLCKKALLGRIQRLETVKAKVAPILYVEGAFGVCLDPEDYVIDIFKNGRASISLGYIGLHETVIALHGQETHIFDSKEKQDEALKITQVLRAATDSWKDETGYGFSLYSTPSENLCDRFCRLDTKEFGIVPGVTDKGYYTNSFHLDVAHKVTPFEKIDFECSYPEFANGGFISYTEYPDMKNNLKGLESVWDYSYNKLPYLGTNLPVDKCYCCGFDGEFSASAKGFECPECGNHDSTKMEVIRRVCGYLSESNSRPLNEGKQAEVMLRVKHLNNPTLD